MGFFLQLNSRPIKFAFDRLVLINKLKCLTSGKISQHDNHLSKSKKHTDVTRPKLKPESKNTFNFEVRIFLINLRVAQSPHFRSIDYPKYQVDQINYPPQITL